MAFRESKLLKRSIFDNVIEGKMLRKVNFDSVKEKKGRSEELLLIRK